MLNFNDLIFKPVVGYEASYLVSSCGVVISAIRQKPIAQRPTSTSPYLRVNLWKNNKSKGFGVHRLVAQAFCTNPYNKPEVNHLNGDKLDNRAENLEWVTRSENVLHAHTTGLKLGNQSCLGKKMSNSSTYHNVSWDNSRKKWVGSIKQARKTIGQKRFNTEVEAALHVNYLLDKYDTDNRPRNIIK